MLGWFVGGYMADVPLFYISLVIFPVKIVPQPPLPSFLLVPFTSAREASTDRLNHCSRISGRSMLESFCCSSDSPGSAINLQYAALKWMNIQLPCCLLEPYGTHKEFRCFRSVPGLFGKKTPHGRGSKIRPKSNMLGPQMTNHSGQVRSPIPVYHHFSMVPIVPIAHLGPSPYATDWLKGKFTGKPHI